MKAFISASWCLHLIQKKLTLRGKPSINLEESLKIYQCGLIKPAVTSTRMEILDTFIKTVRKQVLGKLTTSRQVLKAMEWRIFLKMAIFIMHSEPLSVVNQVPVHQARIMMVSLNQKAERQQIPLLFYG